MKTKLKLLLKTALFNILNEKKKWKQVNVNTLVCVAVLQAVVCVWCLWDASEICIYARVAFIEYIKTGQENNDGNLFFGHIQQKKKKSCEKQIFENSAEKGIDEYFFLIGRNHLKLLNET